MSGDETPGNDGDPTEGEPTASEASDDEGLDNVIQLHGGGPREVPPVDTPAPSSTNHDLSPPNEAELPAALEALLLAADGPVSTGQLDSWLGGPGEARVKRSLLVLAEELDQARRGFKLVQVAKGWQYRTDIRFSRWVQRMRGGRPARLSKAALDTLSILAYRQPATRSEVDELRGVDSGGVLRVLCERGLATVVGRKDAPGRPLMYGTTRNFLALFGLRDLSELPTLSDLRALRRDDSRLPPGAAELLGLDAEGLEALEDLDALNVINQGLTEAASDGEGFTQPHEDSPAEAAAKKERQTRLFNLLGSPGPDGEQPSAPPTADGPSEDDEPQQDGEDPATNGADDDGTR